MVVLDDFTMKQTIYEDYRANSNLIEEAICFIQKHSLVKETFKNPKSPEHEVRFNKSFIDFIG